ncbi:MAG: YwaF family protein [Clostridia bacterium]|nr:YwaF family protein [Clostridia bacterium]
MAEFLREYFLPMLHPMQRPEAWGGFHTCFFFIGIPAAVILAFFLRKLKGRGEKRLFLSVGVILILSEIFKQLAYTTIEGAYRFDLIPFQLCSIPMYLCIIIGVMPENTFTRISKTFIATFGLMGGVASYIAPGTMCREWLELTLHSFIWHLVLIFLGFYVFFSNIEELGKRDFAGAVLMYFSLCIIAFAINLICINAPGADVNMFYIGPKPSNLPVCREITARFGVAANSIVYALSLSACAFLIFVSEKILKFVFDRK